MPVLISERQKYMHLDGANLLSKFTNSVKYAPFCDHSDVTQW